MQELQLNDGTVLADSYAICSGRLFFYLSGVTMAEAFALMNDPEKTCVIISRRYGTEQEFDGYTDLVNLTKEDDGRITGSLRRGTDV